MFVLWCLVTSATLTVAIWCLVTSPKSPVILVDPWWLENEHRWLGLRDQLLTERDTAPPT